MTASELSDEQLLRYARHVVLDEVGEEGQAKLLASSALIVGAGGLGSPLMLYLAAAGIGRIGIVDDDTVDLTNLQRQVIHRTEDVGRPKVESALDGARRLNPEIRIEPHRTRLTAANAAGLIGNCDIVADGSDNFSTRYLINDACHLMGKTLVAASLFRFEAQLSTFKSHLGAPHPCYRCLFPDRPGEDLVPRCEEAGIIGALAGVMGTLQATEVIKEILGLGRGLSGRLLLYDAMDARFTEIALRRSADCALCGPQATIHDLALHAA
ncbi:MAG: molybdopterin-synthase adenylyltransferase MoeB [Dongiaceae bacterium]